STSFAISTYLLLYSPARHHSCLHSFPTRRSSDLTRTREIDIQLSGRSEERIGRHGPVEHDVVIDQQVSVCESRNSMDLQTDTCRSEEHTSELQSRFDLVCRLLLEKKKQTNNQERS